MSSILMYDRLQYCSNLSISLCSLTFRSFSSKIWYWDIQFLELIFVICSPSSFFISHFKSFLKLSKRAEHISPTISLNECFGLSKLFSILLLNSSGFYSIALLMILTRSKCTNNRYRININNWNIYWNKKFEINFILKILQLHGTYVLLEYVCICHYYLSENVCK